MAFIRLRDHLEQLGLGIAQILGDVRHAVIIELGHLLLLLGDGLPQLGNVGRRIGDSVPQARRRSVRAAERAAARSSPCSTSGVMLSLSSCDRSDLVVIGFDLRFARPTICVLELVDLFLDDLALPFEAARRLSNC